MQNYKQKGETVTLVAPAALSSGDIVKVGSFLGVASGDALISADVEVALKGVFTLTKKTADDVSAGDKLYWDSGNEYLTLTAIGNTFMGLAMADAGTSATTLDVNINVVDAVDTIADKVVLTVPIVSIAAATSHFVAAPVAGNIILLQTAIEGVAQADTAISLEIGGVAVTDSALTITASGSAAGDVDSSTPSAANTVAVGDTIEVICGGEGTTASRANATIVIEES